MGAFIQWCLSHLNYWTIMFLMTIESSVILIVRDSCASCCISCGIQRRNEYFSHYTVCNNRSNFRCINKLFSCIVDRQAAGL